MSFVLQAAAALLAASLLVVAGCGGGRIGKAGDVRLVNAAADQSALDLYAGDQAIAGAIPPYGASGYAEVDAGTRALTVRQASSGAQLAASSIDVAKDGHYAVVAYSSGGGVASVVLGEDEAGPSSGFAKVRVFNSASVEAGTLDAYLAAGGCTALSSSNAVGTGLTAKTAPGSFAAFAARSDGTRYHLCVTGSGDTSDLRLDLSGLTLVSGQVTTVVLTPTPGGVLVNAVVVDQQGSATAKPNASARLRVVADAAGGAPVQVAVNGSALASVTASPTVGAYAMVTAGPLSLDVTIGGVALATSTYSAAAGADLTLLVAGTATTSRVTVLSDDNRLSTATASPVRLRLVHGLNGLGSTLNLTADGKLVASGVSFAAASAATNVAVGTGVVFEVTSPASTGPILSLKGTDALPLASGGVYTFFLLGDAAKPAATLRQDR